MLKHSLIFRSKMAAPDCSKISFLIIISLIGLDNVRTAVGQFLCEGQNLNLNPNKSNNSPLSRSERDIDLDHGIPLPYPSEVLDDLFSRRLFNTTMNYIVPCVEVTLPLRTEDGNAVHLAMQAFLGLFSAIAWVATVAIPLMLTELKPIGLKRSLDTENTWTSSGFSIHLPSKKLSRFFNEKVAQDIGLDWDSCLKKTICQAKVQPDTYGWLSLPFLVLYPSFSTGTNILKSEDCNTEYPCFFDVLDLTQYIYRSIMFKNAK